MTPKKAHELAQQLEELIFITVKGIDGLRRDNCIAGLTMAIVDATAAEEVIKTKPLLPQPFLPKLEMSRPISKFKDGDVVKFRGGITDGRDRLYYVLEVERDILANRFLYSLRSMDNSFSVTTAHDNELELA